MSVLDYSPTFSDADAIQLATVLFSIDVEKVRSLPSERDQNFRLTDASGHEFVLKISNSTESRELLVAQNKMMGLVSRDLKCDPRVVPSKNGNGVERVKGAGGADHFVRLVTFAQGHQMGELENHSPELLSEFGRTIARVTQSLAGFEEECLDRTFHWDFAQAIDVISDRMRLVADFEQRQLIGKIVENFKLITAPALSNCSRSVIHNDANDGNVVVNENIVSLIDYGDAVYSWTIGELAIAISYAILEKPDPLRIANQILAGYVQVREVSDAEVEALYGLICIRLCVSVVMAAEQHAARPDDPYLMISQQPIRKTLPLLAEIPFEFAKATFRATAGMDTFQEVIETRAKKTAGSLKLSYQEPLKIVRGWKHYLFDSTGRRYLDAYNNVPHVGHCHPEVVARISAQLKLLNTNTRYLSDVFNEFATRLTATMPDPLNVCMIVNSASEANELALRMARAKTGQTELIVLEGAYHGHTTTLIDISPYKHDGPGGTGAPVWVHTAPIADTYRGPHRDATTAGANYAASVGEIIARIESDSKGLSGFIAESCPSVGGQIIFPEGFLSDVYQRVRAAGGICIADDVQTGYGRLGSAFYGYELQRVVPDIVILGKPIGNGHPLAAVVTTREIADAFDTGMEYFSTFGGNTVSCAAGLAVLDVLEKEDLQQNAFQVGRYLLEGLSKLKHQHSIIGDVRGSGFFLGVELVRDHGTLEPGANEASFIANRMKELGVLLGTDGPLHNVIKIRPPMTFEQDDADVLLAALNQALAEL